MSVLSCHREKSIGPVGARSNGPRPDDPNQPTKHSTTLPPLTRVGRSHCWGNRGGRLDGLKIGDEIMRQVWGGCILKGRGIPDIDVWLIILWFVIQIFRV